MIFLMQFSNYFGCSQQWKFKWEAHLGTEPPWVASRNRGCHTRTPADPLPRVMGSSLPVKCGGEK